MIPPNTLLYIYEIRGDPGDHISNPPASFIGLWNEEGFSYLFFTKPEDEYVNDHVCARGLPLGSRHEMQYGDWQTGLPRSRHQSGRGLLCRPGPSLAASRCHFAGPVGGIRGWQPSHHKLLPSFHAGDHQSRTYNFHARSGNRERDPRTRGGTHGGQTHRGHRPKPFGCPDRYGKRESERPR